MSVPLESSPRSRPMAMRSAKAIAGSYAIDPRIESLVPGFDVPFFQAGLAGYSDAPMRLVARAHGCPFCVTEALLDQTLINGGKGKTREDPDLLATECGMGDLTDNQIAGLHDHPIAGQVMGTDPDTMANASALLSTMGYDTIDVNLACPVKKIRRRKRGGHFLASPPEAIEVLRAVRDAVPDHLPVTVKMRRSFDDTKEMEKNFQTIFDAAYEMGYAWITVHGRTVTQKYLGPARWESLRDLVDRRPDHLIFGSGDIWCVDDIFLMLETTGVHAVSVARGCIGNPWIFQQAREMLAGQTPSPPTIQQQRDVLLEHFQLSMRLHGEMAASRMMRKFGIKFSTYHPAPAEVKAAFIQVKSIGQWRAVLANHYGGDPPSDHSGEPETDSSVRRRA